MPEGEHRIEGSKETGGPMEYYGTKEIFIADDTVQSIKIKLEQRISASFRAKLKKKFTTPVLPTMISIPAGNFTMGCTSNEDCKPSHKVTLKAFSIAKTEITFDQWDSCVAHGGCDRWPDDEGWGRGSRPVINVSWRDARQYTQWLKKTTGKAYRLPSEAEWEYAARAGSKTTYHWGDSLGKNNAHCYNCGSQWDKNQTAPVGSFAANAFGLQDVSGNVEEWVEDCYIRGYKNAPTDGAAVISCQQEGSRVLRGGAWYNDSSLVALADRGSSDPAHRSSLIGFRVLFSGLASIF